jgi:hypothetical protein
MRRPGEARAELGQETGQPHGWRPIVIETCADCRFTLQA